MKISLCMICGNEAAAIIKCLESAKAAFDQLCLVRAIGNQSPDATIEIAEQWCDRNGKEFRPSEYFNVHPSLKHAPHVDDFATARNMSFGLATGDWILWLDCDDYLDDLNCSRIRQATQNLQYKAYYCLYVVDKEAAPVERERLIQRGCGHWTKPIHETCNITGESAHCPDITVYHSDHRPKHQSSAARNAAILEATLADVPRNYFYLHTELKMLKRKEESAAAGHAALALLRPEQIEERYLVLLNLSELEPASRQEWLMQCASLQPHRREAFANLCQHALNQGMASDAISWWRIMDSLPHPSPLPKTHHAMWYGWARNWLRVRVLAISGHQDQAENEHNKFMDDADYATGCNEFGAPL